MSPFIERNFKIMIKSKEIKGALKYIIKLSGYSISKIFLNDHYELLRETGKLKPYYQKGSSFFGYYDSSPENGYGDVLCNITNSSTKKHPKETSNIEVGLFKKGNFENPDFKFETRAFNWQQGARLMWLDNEKFIYNDFNHMDGFISIIRDRHGKIIKKIEFPHSYSRGNQIFGLNYDLIKKIDPDYGYDQNDPRENDISQTTILNYLKLDDENSHMKLNVEELQENFGERDSTLNHAVLSPDNKKMSVIQRRLWNNNRQDRLLIFSLNQENSFSFSELIGYCEISHYCWLDNNRILLYMKPENNKWGFYRLDIASKSLIKEGKLSGYFDGHPSFQEGNLIFDCYSTIFGFQKIFLMQGKSNVKEVLSLFNPPSFWGSSRCDFHPRFSVDGKYLFFDSVRSGKRQLYRLEL